MAQDLKPHIPFLLYVAKARPSIRKLILHKSTPEELDALLSVVLNTVHDHFTLSGHTKKKLQKYGPFLQALLNKDLGREKKRELLVEFHRPIQILLKGLYQQLLSYG